jgi:hypothetical protein
MTMRNCSFGWASTLLVLLVAACSSGGETLDAGAPTGGDDASSPPDGETEDDATTTEAGVGDAPGDGGSARDASTASGRDAALDGRPPEAGRSEETSAPPDGGDAVADAPSRDAGAPPDGGGTVVDAPPPVSGAVFVSPTGDDANPGTIAEPFYTLSRAVASVQPGTTIYMRGGTFNYNATILLSASGTSAAPIRIVAYQVEKPVLNFSTQPYGADHRGILLTGNHWQIAGLEISYAGDNGLKLEGSHNRIEQCVFHHNGDSGVQLGFGHETVNPNGELCSYNEIINCDSYLNFDFDGRGGNADGFACKMHNGKGNVFRGSRAWRNSDDGWDLYETDWPVEITDCWTWHNGDQPDFDDIYIAKKGMKMSSFAGNGNGFKLGGNGTGGSSEGTHVVKRSIAFDNNFRSKKGFDQNSHKGGVLVTNSLAWGNGYNFMFEEDAESGSANEFVNNVTFAPGTSLGMEFSAASVLRSNSWQLAVMADPADYMDLSEAAAMAPRQPDGSLPANGFGRLVAGSDLIDKGVDIQDPFKGTAPDLGPFEH